MIPTAEEFLRDKLVYFKVTGNNNIRNMPDWETVSSWMIEFTKLHVKAALEAASNNATASYIMRPSCDDHTPYWGPCSTCGSYRNPEVISGINIDKESILNAYPETNII